jgi:hypothetical protein
MAGTDKLPVMRVAVIGAGCAGPSHIEHHMLMVRKPGWIDNPEDVATGIDA